jgi:hypothetical protein
MWRGVGAAAWPAICGTMAACWVGCCGRRRCCHLIFPLQLLGQCSIHPDVLIGNATFVLV